MPRALRNKTTTHRRRRRRQCQILLQNDDVFYALFEASISGKKANVVVVVVPFFYPLLDPLFFPCPYHPADDEAALQQTSFPLEIGVSVDRSNFAPQEL